MQAKGLFRRALRHRRKVSGVVLGLAVLLLLATLGCRAHTLGMATHESLAVVAIASSPVLLVIVPAARQFIRRRTEPSLTSELTHADAVALFEASVVKDFDEVMEMYLDRRRSKWGA
jgi:hypothetical protein